MPKRSQSGYVIGNPDELGVSPEVQDYLVRMAEEYLAGRPAPDAPPQAAGGGVSGAGSERGLRG